ncbi:WXG100 family type VII secretion target [Streptosporangium sp. NPDC003464]
MAQQTQVSEADLVAAINWIEESAGRIRDIQKKLDTAGAELKVNWVGQSHAAFDKVHRLWHQRIDVILGSLQTLAENIGSNNKNYAAFNQEREQAINQIEALINAAAPAQYGK